MNISHFSNVDQLDEWLTAVNKSSNREKEMYEREFSLLEQVLVVSQRQKDLRRDARPRSLPHVMKVGKHRFTGRHLHIGSLIVAVGRSLYDEEGRRPLRSRPIGS